jgi:hypothetical protein
MNPVAALTPDERERLLDEITAELRAILATTEEVEQAVEWSVSEQPKLPRTLKQRVLALRIARAAIERAAGRR